MSRDLLATSGSSVEDNANRETLLGSGPWLLNQTPKSPQLSRLYLNGSKAFYVIDYVINGAIVTWLAAIPIESTDLLEIYYK
jgi:hypothetical protein